MSPIRTAIIGLSASAVTSWAASAHLPYLLSPRGRERYEVVALLNSNVSAAEAARKTFNLPSSIKTYGDPRNLAEDPDVDLVVCCTRVDIHFRTVEPSLRAGKAVFVEWPLAENLPRALALTDDKPVPNSIIGLQGRVSPVTLRLKEILAEGVIGKVLSSHVISYGALLPRDALPESMEYFVERKRGGNPIIIENGHSLDWVHEVLGEFEEFDSRMQIQRPKIKILGSGERVRNVVETDVPDLLSTQGTLKARECDGEVSVAEGALFTHIFRHGPPFKGQPGVSWVINGEKGELLVTMGERFLFLEDPIVIQLHDHATNEVKELAWDWADWQKDLPVKARGVAELYERYAEWFKSGQENIIKGREWPTLADAVLRMRQFDQVFQQFDQAKERRLRERFARE